MNRLELITINRKNIRYPIELVLALLGDKWSFLIICKLRKGTMRFNVLKREIGTITTKMLSQKLQDLEKHNFVIRHIYSEKPPKVEYSLTALGQSLEPIMITMFDWGMENKEHFRETYDITIDSNLEFPQNTPNA